MRLRTVSLNKHTLKICDKVDSILGIIYGQTL